MFPHLFVPALSSAKKLGEYRELLPKSDLGKRDGGAPMALQMQLSPRAWCKERIFLD